MKREACSVVSILSWKLQLSVSPFAYLPHRTYFPDANTIVRMEYGEFILHPGNLVHAGVDITSGERYLMVLFAHTDLP